MKKILSFILVVLMAFGMCGCSFLGDTDDKKDSTENDKICEIGETQTIKDVSLTVKSVESGLYYNNERSQNGSWVKIKFTAKTEKDGSKIYYSDFSLNDGYTIRETPYATNIKLNGFALVTGQQYDFFVVYDCKYSHYEVDMIFKWTELFSGTRRWCL